MPSPPPKPKETQELAHLSLNPSAPSTILLIHGATASQESWDLVYPHLQQDNKYHILIPSLPGHGPSAHITPFSIPSTLPLLSSLITTHAKAGKAHIIGHSLGAKIAIAFACQYPEQTETVVISGYRSSAPSGILDPALPYAMYLTSHLENRVPRSWVRWAMDGTDLPRSDGVSLELWKQITQSTDAETFATTGTKGDGDEDEEDSAAWPRPWPARTLVVAAGKGDWLVPSADRTQDAVRLAAIGRRGNERTRAVVHPRMRHAWPRQDGRLFAAMVVGWIERGEVLEGFEAL